MRASLHAIKINRVIPEECVIFEDAVKGITAARSANVGFIIGVNSNDNKSELEGTDAIVDNFTNLTYESLVKLLSSACVTTRS